MTHFASFKTQCARLCLVIALILAGDNRIGGKLLSWRPATAIMETAPIA